MAIFFNPFCFSCIQFRNCSSFCASQDTQPFSQDISKFLLFIQSNLWINFQNITSIFCCPKSVLPSRICILPMGDLSWTVSGSPECPIFDFGEWDDVPQVLWDLYFNLKSLSINYILVTALKHGSLWLLLLKPEFFLPLCFGICKFLCSSLKVFSINFKNPYI